MDTSDVSIGQTFINERGIEVTVYQINRSRDLVVLESEEGHFEMSLQGLTEAIEDGDYEEVTGEAEEDEVSEEES